MQNERSANIGWRQSAIILLALATAAIHISLFFPDVMFILNGLGYIALTAAIFLPIPFLRQNRKLVRLAFMAYTLITILLWVAFGMRTPLGYITKGIEVLLLGLLAFERP